MTNASSDRSDTVRPLGQRLYEADKRLRGSKGWRLHSRLQELDVTYRIHLGNFAELKRWVQEVTAQDQESAARLLNRFRQDNARELNATLEEAARRLHNFLASAKTLVDHCRNHVRDLYGERDFETEYREAIGTLLQSKPVCRFVHGLRNYNLHYRLPFVTGTLHIKFDPPGEAKTMTSQIHLSVEPLLKWDRWDRPAKNYLRDAGEELPIEKLAIDYMSAIDGFYKWQRGREMQINRTILGRVDARIHEILRMEDEFRRTDQPPAAGSGETEGAKWT